MMPMTAVAHQPLPVGCPTNCFRSCAAASTASSGFVMSTSALPAGVDDAAALSAVPGSPALALFLAFAAASSASLLACCSDRTVAVRQVDDGGNLIKAPTYAILCKRHHSDPRNHMDTIHIYSAFTNRCLALLSQQLPGRRKNIPNDSYYHFNTQYRWKIASHLTMSRRMGQACTATGLER
jgi:hypothetical protein